MACIYIYIYIYIYPFFLSYLVKQRFLYRILWHRNLDTQSASAFLGFKNFSSNLKSLFVKSWLQNLFFIYLLFLIKLTVGSILVELNQSSFYTAILLVYRTQCWQVLKQKCEEWFTIPIYCFLLKKGDILEY